MIGSNTDDGGSKSNELEFLLWPWLGDDSIFSKESKCYDEVLQSSFLKEDKDLASDLSSIALKFAPLLARMRSCPPLPLSLNFDMHNARQCVLISLFLSFTVSQGAAKPQNLVEAHLGFS